MNVSAKRADDLRVAASHNAVHFFNSGIKSHPEKLTPLIARMLKAPQADVAKEGAREVAARWLFEGYFEYEVENCLRGSAPQRKGLAQVAAHFVAEPEHFDKCKSIIVRLKDDPEEDVRQALVPVFRMTGLLRSPKGITLLRSLVDSLRRFLINQVI